ncbi:hypothetical protein [Clostridioides difficile]|uniref:hypothetical protein n=1 Tax=Clostridioides difficile TaxID=1496 RepID=UPI0015DF5B60|nr:hypothetical protein [Clostridioides difficile]
MKEVQEIQITTLLDYTENQILKKRVYDMFKNKGKSGILIALILCLLSSFTYFKFDSIISKPINHSLDAPLPVNTGKEKSFTITID